ncbi:MAG: hypothetical protein ACT4P6_15425, partial [Gemmatimonadaceae bacterium]
WEYKVLKVGSNNTPQPLTTTARMIMTSRGSLILMLPVADIPASNPGVRFTAFRHSGDFGLSGGPWAGDVQRPVTQPLFNVPPVPLMF